MENADTYKKYVKYKNKYIKLKQQINNNNNYYLIHGTDLPHIEKILKQGYILSGKYLADDETRLGGWEKLPYIYCNIYFDDIKNLPYSFGYSLIIDPLIIKECGIVFNKGWKVHPNEDSINIKSHDTDYDKKIAAIKEFIKYPEQYSFFAKTPDGKVRLPPMMVHEVLIKDKIDVHKYVIGLVLPGMAEMTDSIQKILDENMYDKIKIFTTSDLPNAKEIFTN